MLVPGAAVKAHGENEAVGTIEVFGSLGAKVAGKPVQKPGYHPIAGLLTWLLGTIALKSSDIFFKFWVVQSVSSISLFWGFP